MESSTVSEDRELRQLVLHASILPVTLMLAVAGLLAWQVVTLLRHQAWVDLSDVVISRANAIGALELEREGAIRGVLLSGDASFAATYREADEALRAAMPELASLVAGDPAQADRLQRVAKLDAAWREGASEVVAAPQRAASAGLLARAKVLADLRRELRAFVDAERKLRAERSGRALRASRNVLLSVVPLTLLLGGALMLLARRQRRRVADVYRRAATSAREKARALQESEERFRLFVEGVRDAAVYVLDPEGRVQSWNVGAERITGYRPDEVLGRNVSMFFPPEDVPEGFVERELSEAAAKGQVDHEGWRRRANGTRFWASITTRALRGDDGRIVGYGELVRDTTDRKRVDMRRAAQFGVARALSEASSFAEALPRLLEAVGKGLGYEVALAWAGQAGRHRACASWARPTPRTERFLERARGLRLTVGEAAPGRVAASREPEWTADARDPAGPPLHPEAAAAGFRSALVFPLATRGEVSVVVELLASDPRARDEELLQFVAALALPAASFLERERTREEARLEERRRADELEASVRERTQELTSLNRELEALSSSLSRELQEPLRAIADNARALLEGDAERLGAGATARIEAIRSAGHAMEKRVEDVVKLAHAPHHELRRQPFDLSAVFREVASEVQRLHPERRLEVAVEDGIRARGDPRLLRAGLVNLVSSAFKQGDDRAAPRLEFGVSALRGARVYRVRDSGLGLCAGGGAVDEGSARGERPPDQGEGGLATWQRIVQRHGGRVWTETSPGKGASIYFTLGES